MSSNAKLIINHVEQYKELYYNKFNDYPTSWYSYLKWLATSTTSSNYTPEDVEIAKMVLIC